MSELTRWDPSRRWLSVRDAMDRMFEDALTFPRTLWPFAEGAAHMPSVDLRETDEDFVVEATLPGLSPEEVDVSVVGNVLTIKAETKREQEKGEKGKYHIRERRWGTFQRVLNLPTQVDVEAAEAVFDKGVLKLTLPKVAEAKGKTIPVKGT